MKFTRKRMFLALAGAVLFGVGYRIGYDEPVSEIGIARVEFLVVDAQSGKPLELFDYSSPSMSSSKPYRGAYTMLKGSAFNSFQAISDEPLTFSVWEEGYESEMVEVPLEVQMGSVSSGHHGSEILTIRLNRRAEQD